MKHTEFIAETAEENYELINVSHELAKALIFRLYYSTKSIADFALLIGGVTAKDLKVNYDQTTLIGKVLGDLRFLAYKVTPVEMHGVFRTDMVIFINTLSLLATPKNKRQEQLQNTIAHELQHAIDYVKSQGKGLTNLLDLNAINAMPYSDYAKQQYEVNARFSEALLYIVKNLPTENLNALIAAALTKHHLTTLLTTKQYQRLRTRVYKFLEHYNSVQNHNTKVSILAKLKKFFGIL